MPLGREAAMGWNYSFGTGEIGRWFWAKLFTKCTFGTLLLCWLYGEFWAAYVCKVDTNCTFWSTLGAALKLMLWVAWKSFVAVGLNCSNLTKGTWLLLIKQFFNSAGCWTCWLIFCYSFMSNLRCTIYLTELRRVFYTRAIFYCGIKPLLSMTGLEFIWIIGFLAKEISFIWIVYSFAFDFTNLLSILLLIMASLFWWFRPLLYI